jgi:hypothetical protein
MGGSTNSKNDLLRLLLGRLTSFAGPPATTGGAQRAVLEFRVEVRGPNVS